MRYLEQALLAFLCFIALIFISPLVTPEVRSADTLGGLVWASLLTLGPLLVLGMALAVLCSAVDHQRHCSVWVLLLWFGLLLGTFLGALLGIADWQQVPEGIALALLSSFFLLAIDALWLSLDRTRDAEQRA